MATIKQLKEAARVIACKPRRLIVLRNHAPHVQFIVSAARGVEVRP